MQAAAGMVHRRESFSMFQEDRPNSSSQNEAKRPGKRRYHGPALKRGCTPTQTGAYSAGSLHGVRECMTGGEEKAVIDRSSR